MKLRFYIFGLLITILFSAGCVPTKDLGEDEKLLVRIKPVGLKHIEKSQIENLYQQEPNRMFLGSTPYLWIYNVGKKFYNPARIEERRQKQINKWREKVQAAGDDTVKVRKIRNKYSDRVNRLREKKEEGNFLMQLGEPPAIYDSVQMAETIEQISIFLNANGYFNHTIDLNKKVRDKLVYVTLQINEHQPYRYDSISYAIPDTAILSLVKSAANRSLIKLNDIYNEEKLTEERTRLYELLRNNGYYDFARAYIEFEIDTLGPDPNSAAISTIIRNPETGGKHQVYRINKVYFKTDADRFGIPRDTIKYNNINYVAYRHRYSPKILDKKVNIYPGNRFSQLNTATTQRQLADLDVFQFNNILYTKVTDAPDSSNLLNASINALPSRRFQETTEIGINYTERTPGPFASIRLRMRNVFGGAENLDLGIRGGFEGQVSLTENETVMIKEFGGDMALTFPVIIFPGSLNILSKYNPRTRIYTGYTSVDRMEYKRSSYELSLDYIWQKARNPLQTPTLQYVLSPLNLTIVEADTNTFSTEFREALRRFRSFEESFRSGIISSMAFSATYNTNDFAQTRNARLFRTTVEVGGLTKELGLDLLINNLQTFQFARINPDYRRYIPLGNKRYFAYRINTGVASPIFSADILPYEKYFFAGGPSSVRAWQSRRLGPGSYAEPDEATGERNFNAEQPGNVLFELSTEYRFNIFSFLNGALFVDAGNVWTLEQEPARPGASFRFDSFYKELAVGTGFGLRFDLTVLVLRFDFATKVYDPGGINGKKFVLGDFRFSDFFTRNNQSNLNIGIGYPF